MAAQWHFLRYSALVTTLLIAAFFATKFGPIAMGLEINCGCFGPGERLGPKTLLHDGAFLVFGAGDDDWSVSFASQPRAQWRCGNVGADSSCVHSATR